MLCNLCSILVFLLLLYLTVLYESTAACALMLLLFVMILVGIPGLIYNCFHLKFLFPDVLLDVSGKNKGIFTITVQNTGCFSISRISMKLGLLDANGKVLCSKKLTLSVSPKKTAVFTAELSSGCCGKFQISLGKAGIYSAFSLLYLPIPLRFQGEAVFYPEVLPLDMVVSETTRYFAAECDGFEELVPGTALLPMNQIREFLPGDRVRQIHWKLSARTEELLVRDLGKPEGFPVLLFLRLQPLSGKDAALWQSSFYEFAASLSFSLLEHNCNHFVIWYDSKEQTILRYPVRTEEELDVLLYALLHQKISESPTELYDLYSQKYPGDTFCTKLLLTADLTLFSGDVQLLSCKGTDWKQEAEAFTFTV